MQTGKVNKRGYIGVTIKGRYYLQHTLIVEEVLGKKLPRSAQVHHVDGCGTNNSKNNLIVCQDSAYHHFLHKRTEEVKPKWEYMDYRVDRYEMEEYKAQRERPVVHEMFPIKD